MWCSGRSFVIFTAIICLYTTSSYAESFCEKNIRQANECYFAGKTGPVFDNKKAECYIHAVRIFDDGGMENTLNLMSGCLSCLPKEVHDCATLCNNATTGLVTTISCEENGKKYEETISPSNTWQPTQRINPDSTQLLDPAPMDNSTASRTDLGIVHVNLEEVFVLSGPGLNEDKVESVSKSTPLEALQETDYWVRVRTPSKKEGWVAKKWLRESQ